MDQVKHTMLIAQAKAEIVSFMLQGMNIPAAEARLMSNVKKIVDSFQLDSSEANAIQATTIPRLGKELQAYVEQKADEEITAAIKGAESLRGHWVIQFADQNGMHQAMHKSLSSAGTPLPKDADDEFHKIAAEAHNGLVKIANDWHADFMEILRKKELLSLQHCFRKHLVSASTAEELGKLYKSA